MKKFIKASEQIDIRSNADIVKFLQSKDIDTTKYKYELKFTIFERFGEENRNKLRFTCPGDYLALFSTRMASPVVKESIPNFDNLSDYFGISYFVDIVNDNPTYQRLYKYGDYEEWFDREEYGYITLTNLSTGRVLVEPEGEYYESEDEEDWED